MTSTAPGPRPTIIDCDPGHDDAICLLVALASPEAIELLGITCVAGNAELHKTQRNARQVVDLTNRRDVPVLAGCARPMVRPLITAEAIHGVSGLELPDGQQLPEPITPLAPGHAVDFIIDTCLAASHEAQHVTLCPTGPLTNIAMAMVKEPAIIPTIREVVLMGGAAINPGNVTPAAEFNILVDPHAAHVVFTSGVPLRMMGLDVTHQVQTTPARLQQFRDLDTRAGKVASDLLTFFNSYDIHRYGFEGAPLHDPCVVAYLLQPELFGFKRVHVAVETCSPTTLGQTVTDWWSVTGQDPNCDVAATVDAEGFYALLLDRLGRL